MSKAAMTKLGSLANLRRTTGSNREAAHAVRARLKEVQAKVDETAEKTKRTKQLWEEEFADEPDSGSGG